jgi:uncharacterized protein
MQRFLLRAVLWYQKAAEGRPSPCRFFPSCSEYASEALEIHGAGRGSWLTVRRLARCRPFGPSGFDPVPEAHGPDCDHTMHDTRVSHPSPVSAAPSGASVNVKVS